MTHAIPNDRHAAFQCAKNGNPPTFRQIRQFPWWNKLYRAVRASWLYNRALDLSAHGSYEEALTEFAKIEALVPIDSEMLIAKAHFLHMTHNHGDGHAAFEEAWLHVEHDAYLNDHEKAYLKAYVHAFGSVSARLSRGEWKYIKPLDMASIDLDRVGAGLKRNFPLVEHPFWPKDDTAEPGAADHS